VNEHDSLSMGPPEASGSLRRRLLEASLIGLLALTLNLAGNGRISLWNRDEPRYAGCVREMRANGDLVHPTFNAQPRYDKPILIYWLMLGGVALGGDNPFGARLVSAIAGASTCLVVWALGRRMFGAQAGRLSALILATAPIMVVESKLSTTDATLTFWLVSAQACLWVLNTRRSKLAAAGFWMLLALATLTKGPIGPVLIAVAGLVSWWWGGPVACWSRLHWKPGLLGFLLLTAPWYVAVGFVSHGEFFRVAMGYHVIRRMTSGVEQHGAFPGYYVVTSLLTFHPWSALLPAAVAGAWVRRRKQPEFAFLLGWIVGPLILLELVRTKLVHYYLPAYPACALLAGWLIIALARDEVNLRRWSLGRLSIGLLGGVGIGSTAVLIAAAIVLPAALRWPCLGMAGLIGAGTLLAIERFQSGATTRAAGTLITTWALILGLMGVWLLPAAEPYRDPRLVAERLAELAAKYGALPMLATFQEPSMVYTLGHPVPIFHGLPDLHERLRHDGAVVSALLPGEIAALRADPELDIEIPETRRVVNLSKGQSKTLGFALIRLRPSHSGGLAVQAQQTLVK
jgi:4-amino-4-deoxy-L-arabinose transferase-like glycosyltransferase